MNYLEVGQLLGDALLKSGALLAVRLDDLLHGRHILRNNKNNDEFDALIIF